MSTVARALSVWTRVAPPARSETAPAISNTTSAARRWRQILSRVGVDDRRRAEFTECGETSVGKIANPAAMQKQRLASAPRIRPSTLAAVTPRRLSGMAAVHADKVHCDNGTASRMAATVRINVSESTCRINRLVDAPSARRMANSVCRALRWTRTRLPVLMQATSSPSSPAAATSSSVGRISSTRASRIGMTRSVGAWESWAVNAPLRVSRRTSACAVAARTPGASRARKAGTAITEAI